MTDADKLPGFGQFLTDEGEDGTGQTDAYKLARIREEVTSWRMYGMPDDRLEEIEDFLDSPPAVPGEPSAPWWPHDPKVTERAQETQCERRSPKPRPTADQIIAQLEANLREELPDWQKAWLRGIFDGGPDA